MQQTKQRISPLDFFIHIAILASLVTAVIAVVSLFFEAINFHFPDVLEGSTMRYSSYLTEPIRRSMAFVIVAVPIFIGLRHFVRKREENPFFRWVIHGTIFAALLTIVIALAILIYTFLGGELTTRFILKILALVALSSITLGLYWSDLKGRKSVIWITLFSVVALLGLVLGFSVIGSPAKQRDLRLDAERINDLESIQWMVTRYWEEEKALPTKLEDISSTTYGTLPSDPEGRLYEYKMTGEREFELCATFTRAHEYIRMTGGPAMMERSSIAPGYSNWEHDGGYHCFARSVRSIEKE